MIEITAGINNKKHSYALYGPTLNSNTKSNVSCNNDKLGTLYQFLEARRIPNENNRRHAGFAVPRRERIR